MGTLIFLQTILITNYSILDELMNFKKGNNMLVGYARVSTSEQSLYLQLDALKKAECSKIYEDHISVS